MGRIFHTLDNDLCILYMQKFYIFTVSCQHIVHSSHSQPISILGELGIDQRLGEDVSHILIRADVLWHDLLVGHTLSASMVLDGDVLGVLRDHAVLEVGYASRAVTVNGDRSLPAHHLMEQELQLAGLLGCIVESNVFCLHCAGGYMSLLL
jgi:hypothetical protein